MRISQYVNQYVNWYINQYVNQYIIQYVSFPKKFLDESHNKPNKMWVDKGSEVYNRSMKSWLQDNDIETY